MFMKVEDIITFAPSVSNTERRSPFESAKPKAWLFPDEDWDVASDALLSFLLIDVIKSQERDTPYLFTYLIYLKEIRRLHLCYERLGEIYLKTEEEGQAVEVFPTLLFQAKSFTLGVKIASEIDERYRLKSLKDLSMHTLSLVQRDHHTEVSG